MSLPVRLCQQEWISASRIDTVSLQFFFFLPRFTKRDRRKIRNNKNILFLYSQSGDEGLELWFGGRGRHMCHHFGREALSSFGCHLPPIKKRRKSWSSRPFHDSITQWASRTLPTTTSYLSVLVNTNFIQRKQKRKKRKQKKGSTSKYMAVLGLRAPPCW